MRRHSKMSFPSVAALLLALPLGSMGGCSVEGPGEQEDSVTVGLTRRIFDAVEETGPTVFAARAVPKSERRVAVNMDALESQRLVLNLPGRELIAVSSAISEREESAEWIGKIEGESTLDNEVIVTRNHGVVSGYIRLDGVVYEIEPTAAGETLFFERSSAAIEDDEEDTVAPAPKPAPAPAGTGPSHEAALVLGSKQIDVMIVYTTAAKVM